ncbi:hypothetical protein A3I48_01590 [Candidatus Daviesbacteria bacterium RIFCSPLOWO2_02_FULL_36_7]|uniref:PIN domain-containing protein n=1 Tax=Candidatus Daviesbacteria bacterium RIFCSPLOWO2_02_FULL_36_7 TaxID=1797792 RepID=A0A1F5MHF8_9BACT|nr:MAG: hypothetical protein A3I48_01590 [Candidatus Daviesbacteria bacterium RIFCSPLOWO2_02_FULL_36_7]
MVNRKVVVDTSVIIDHLRQVKKSETLLRTTLEDKHTAFIISSDVIQELFAGQSSKAVEPKDEIRKILQSFHIIDVTSKIAELAGQIMRDTKPGVQFADAAIAATAILNQARLLTLNKKDFQGIKDLEFV